MQRVADLEPQRVARAEAAGGGTAGDDPVPELTAALRRNEQLDAELARVPGPIDDARHAVDLAVLERERRRLREPEPLERARPLHGEQRVVVRDVAHLRPGELALLEPREIGLAVRRVHDQQEAIGLALVDDQVVDDPALLVRQQRVLRLPGTDPLDVVREHRLQELPRTRGPRPRARPCARRRRRRSRSAPRGAPGSRPRTARASPSRRTERAERRGRRAGRRAASGAASASALMLKEPGSPPALGRAVSSRAGTRALRERRPEPRSAPPAPRAGSRRRSMPRRAPRCGACAGA